MRRTRHQLPASIGPVTSVDTTPVVEMLLLHRLTRQQLVTVLAVMTACGQHHAVRALNEQPADELAADAEQHIIRFGVDGRPTHPMREHYAWAETAVDKVLPLLRGDVPPA